MRSLHLTIMAVCHILLASAILYLTTFSTLEASPLVGQPKPNIDDKAPAAAVVVSSVVNNDAKKPEQYSPGQLSQEQNQMQPLKPQKQSAHYAQQSPTDQASSPISSQNVISQTNNKQSIVSPSAAVASASGEPVVVVVPQFNAPAEIPVANTKASVAAGSVAQSGESIKQQVMAIKVADMAEMVGKSVAAAGQPSAPAVKSTDPSPSNGKDESIISEKKSPAEQKNIGAVSEKQEQPMGIVKVAEAPIIEEKAPASSQPISVVAQQAPSVTIESNNNKPNIETKQGYQDQGVQAKQALVKSPPAEVIEPRSAPAVPEPAALVAEPQQQPSPVSGKSGVSQSYEPKSIVVKEESYEKKQQVPQAVKLDRKIDDVSQQSAGGQQQAEQPAKVEASAKQVQQSAPAAELASSQVSAKSQDHSVQQQETAAGASKPVVKGGLGPLQLLATTLCSFQPDKQVADENLNQLYARRANLRKSLLEFMSLKFTNLEKLSSRLGSGLQVVPLKTVSDSASPARASGAGSAPSHGWPVVGKCTAHDLKLMGEAAWCEDELGNAASSGDSKPVVAGAAIPSSSQADEAPAKITSNQHATSARAQAARSIGSSMAFLPSPEQSSVISKLLHVNDIKDAPVVESTIYNLNLTQQQLASLEAQATSTRECRRNALRYTKALFNHLAEDQRNVSESWPQLYGLISADDCARKRMIDIVTALSGFRTDTTSIRRDNLEFAFAMDDLRSKVLENEVNVPLTFDKQFIEVEQFLQQSVRLMLSNIDPNRAKLTSMRYRSLMYGTVSADDQCIELHQRLLAQSYPTDCNPNQFGQLPDVLRMTASSLELWSIEKEISLRTGKVVDYPNIELVGQQKVKEDVNECIANLVSS